MAVRICLYLNISPLEAITDDIVLEHFKKPSEIYWEANKQMNF